MIERYSTPEMTSLWSEANRYRVWLTVELAATKAWEAMGEVPAGTSERLATKAAANPLDDAFAARVAELEAQTRHDIVAFTRALTERFGEDARFIHLGLTSTDVVDSAQNLVLREALGLILEDARALLGELKDKAVTYKHTPCIGRTHGIHAEPTTFGLKFLNFYAALLRDLKRIRHACNSISVLMLSGSVGTYAHVPPPIETRVAAALGLAP